MGQAPFLEDPQLALGRGIALQPEWIVPSCCTQLLSPAPTCSVLGSLKRADGGALVVPEVALDLCLEKDMPSAMGYQRKLGRFFFIPAVRFVLLAGCLSVGGTNGLNVC